MFACQLINQDTGLPSPPPSSLNNMETSKSWSPFCSSIHYCFASEFFSAVKIPKKFRMGTLDQIFIYLKERIFFSELWDADQGWCWNMRNIIIHQLPTLSNNVIYQYLFPAFSYLHMYHDESTDMTNHYVKN
jgi:hypothetical protein